MFSAVPSSVATCFLKVPGGLCLSLLALMESTDFEARHHFSSRGPNVIELYKTRRIFGFCNPIHSFSSHLKMQIGSHQMRLECWNSHPELFPMGGLPPSREVPLPLVRELLILSRSGLLPALVGESTRCEEILLSSVVMLSTFARPHSRVEFKNTCFQKLFLENVRFR